MRKHDFSLFAITINLYRLFFAFLSLQVIHGGPLVAAALLGADVLDALLSQLATLALGAVGLGLLLVDVVVLAAACLDVFRGLVVVEARIVGNRLGLGRWLVVLVGRDWFVVVSVVELATVHLINVDLCAPLVHDVVVLVDSVASLLCQDVLDVVCVHGWLLMCAGWKIPFILKRKSISIFFIPST